MGDRREDGEESKSMGISTVGQLAKFPLELLEKKFGIMGNQLFYHAHGIDLSAFDARTDKLREKPDIT